MASAARAMKRQQQRQAQAPLGPVPAAPNLVQDAARLLAQDIENREKEMMEILARESERLRVDIIPVFEWGKGDLTRRILIQGRP